MACLRRCKPNAGSSHPFDSGAVGTEDGRVLGKTCQVHNCLRRSTLAYSLAGLWWFLFAVPSSLLVRGFVILEIVLALVFIYDFYHSMQKLRR